jgi:DNA-binding NarL/FixJ family response regulator
MTRAERERLGTLTKRQCAILHLIRDGLTNEDIRLQLGLTGGVFVNSKDGLMKKLNIKREVDLKLFAAKVR